MLSPQACVLEWGVIAKIVRANSMIEPQQAGEIGVMKTWFNLQSETDPELGKHGNEIANFTN